MFRKSVGKVWKKCRLGLDEVQTRCKKDKKGQYFNMSKLPPK